MLLRLTPLIVLVSVISGEISVSFNHSARLFEEVIDPFDRRIRPVLNQTSPIVVNVVISLLSLLSVDEIKQKVEFNSWVNFTWIDEIRSWDPDQYGGIPVLFPEPLDVWRPRILISNSLQERDPFEDDYSPLIVRHDGVTRWYPASIFSTSCILELTHFPFDEQVCSMYILTNDFIEAVTFEAYSSEVDLSGYLDNGEWELRTATIMIEIPVFGDERRSQVSIKMVIRRRPRFFLVNVVVPIMFLSLLSCLVFILPEESGERASYAITVLLSLAVFMSFVSAQLPQTSDSFPIICEYLLALLVNSGVSVVATVVHMRWHHIRRKRKWNGHIGSPLDAYPSRLGVRFNDVNPRVDDANHRNFPSFMNRDDITRRGEANYDKMEEDSSASRFMQDRLNASYPSCGASYHVRFQAVGPDTPRQHGRRLDAARNESGQSKCRLRFLKLRVCQFVENHINAIMFSSFIISWVLLTVCFMWRLVP